MKKIFVIIAVLMLTLCASSFVACGHKHTIETIDYLAPTCTEDGYKEHYSCTGCGKIFADAEAKEELTEIPVLEKKGHNFCYKILADAYFSSEATCTELATYYLSCICGKAGEETFSYGELKPHVYDQEVVEETYLASVANCLSKATYYKSCVCGEKGEETFETGELGSHVYNRKVLEEEYLSSNATCTAKATYYKSCVCGEKGEETFETGELLPHVYDKEVVEEEFLSSNATCTEKAKYFYSCVCGEKGEDTFETGETLPHVFDQEVVEDKYLANGGSCTQKATYYKSCVCGKAGEETFEYGEIGTHVYNQQKVTSQYLASNATCSSKATYYYSCACGEKGTQTFEYGEVSAHSYTKQVAEVRYLATPATCSAKATYYKSCVCGRKGTQTFAYGELGKHEEFDLIVSDEAIADETTGTYYLSCVECGALGDTTTTVNKFIGVENGMNFKQLDGFNHEMPEDSSLVLERYTVKLTDGTVKAEYTGGSITNFNNTFKTLSPRLVYILEYEVSNGSNTDSYVGSVDFTINTVDTVVIAQTATQIDNLHARGSKSELTYVESNIGGRNGAYEWSTSASATQANCTINLVNNTVNKTNAVIGMYFYFDIYTTSDFPLTFIDAQTSGGKKHYLYSNSYSYIRKFDASGNKVTSNAQSTWKGKWITVEIKLQAEWLFDNTYRGITIPADNNYGLINSDSKHIYLDNFKFATYSIYGEIDGVSECETHTFDAKIPQPKYLEKNATCQAPASFYVSCSVCGAVGTETFSAGEIGYHDYAEVATAEYLATVATCQVPATYYYSCSNCDYVHEDTFSYGALGNHIYDREIALDKYLSSPATSTQNAFYFKSCVCGEKGTETFEYDETLPDILVVTSNPNKTEYLSGETFDPTGMVVMAYLRNGNEELADDLSFSDTVLNYPLESITIYYKGAAVELPLTIYESTVADAIVEVAYAYDRQSGQIHYDQYQARRHLTLSPEEATSQKTIYLDCSSFVNSIYREVFGENIMPFAIDEKSPATSNYNAFARDNTDSVEVVGYWENANYATTQEQSELLLSVKNMLQVGDVLNYRHYRPASNSSAGHVYIYLGGDLFMHCFAGGSFHYDRDNPSNSWEEYAAEADTGMIDTISADDLFTDVDNYRYLFKNTSADRVTSFCLFRPLNRGLSVNQKTIDRMKIAGLTMEKTSSVGVNSAVRTGDTITYTVKLVNKVSKTHTGVTITDVLPTGTAYVADSGSTGVVVNGQNLTWTGDVGSKATVTVSYSVKVTASKAGTVITSDKTYVSGIKLSTINQTVSGFTQTQEDTLVAKALEYVSSGKAFTNPIELASTLYSDALSKNIFSYSTTQNALEDLIDIENLTCKTSTDISKMIAPSLFGGYNIRYGQLYQEDSVRSRLLSEPELAVGDIILADWTGGSIVYIYVGNSKLVACTTSNLTCHELTIGTDIYGDSRVDDDFADNILVTLVAYDRYAVLRPSMV